jgi:hypothetical protein
MCCPRVLSHCKCVKDSEDLQKDLQKLTSWQNKWQMRFNASKCYVTYKLCDQTLEIVDSHPYLGVHLQNDMKWDTQVAHATSKASRILGLIKRNLSNCSEQLKSTAYTSLVRPHTEYAATAWDPHTKAHCKQLERIQRNAARFVKHNYSKSEGTVTKLLQDLEWPSLQSRRSAARLTLMYKMNNDLISIPSDQYLTPVTRQGLRRKNTNTFQQPHCRINTYKNSYFPRTIREWNELPETAVQAKSVDSFKSHLD